MNYHRIALLLFLSVATIGYAAPLATTTKPTSEPAKESGRKDAASYDGDKLSVTHHELKLGDEVLKYEATVGTMAMKDEAGKPRANMFFVAYRKEPGEDFDPSKRPITFVFNGGPGAAAVWLHLGA